MPAHKSLSRVVQVSPRRPANRSGRRRCVSRWCQCRLTRLSPHLARTARNMATAARLAVWHCPHS
eukprot:7052267-Alexandrium_andersonii.AAC.1